MAVLLCHHARKGSNSSRPGQALRGSSELHGWGDSNLYMRRRGDELTLSTEHRAAPSRDHIPLELAQDGSALSLSLLHPGQIEPSAPAPAQRAQKSPAERICETLAPLEERKRKGLPEEFSSRPKVFESNLTVFSQPGRSDQGSSPCSRRRQSR
jgi:hypothetical protein